MNDLDLRKLLQEADETVTPLTPLPSAANIQRTARHRRHLQQARIVALSLCVICAASLLIPHLASSPAIPSPHTAALAAAAPLRSSQVQDLIAERTAELIADQSLTADSSPAEPADSPQALREEASSIMLSIGKHQANESPHNRNAAETYQRTIALFPDTAAAQGARLGLEKLRSTD
jgi:hypothetical protein